MKVHLRHQKCHYKRPVAVSGVIITKPICTVVASRREKGEIEMKLTAPNKVAFRILAWKNLLISCRACEQEKLYYISRNNIRKSCVR